MDGEQNLISLVGPTGVTEAAPEEVPGLLAAGYRRATEKEIKYNQTGQQLLGAGEAVGRGLFGPAFTLAEQHLLGQTSEDIKGREENLGGLATGLEIGSLILPGMALGRVARLAAQGIEATKTAQRLATAAKFTQAGVAEGIANVASRGIEGKLAKLAVHYGVDNAVFSVLDDVDKTLLSSEPKDAIKTTGNVILNSGLSFLVGAGGGAAVGKLGELWKASRAGKVSGALEAAKAVAESADAPAMKTAEKAAEEAAQAVTEPLVKEATEEAVQKAAPAAAPEIPVKPATSLEEMELQALGETVPEMPAFAKENRASVEAAMGRLPDLKIVPTEANLRMLEDPEVYRRMKVAELRNDKLGQRLRNHLMHQKKHYTDKLIETVQGVSEGITGDKIIAGNELAENFAKSYQAEKEALASGFKSFDDVGANPISSTENVFQILKDTFPNIEKYITKNKKGLLQLAKFEGGEGFTEQTRKHIQYLLNAINNKNLTLGELRNYRELIRDEISAYGTSGKTKKFSGQLVTKLFGMLETEAEQLGVPEVRETFKRYAINERNREIFEKIVGGDLLGENVLEKQIKPENVINRIFQNSTNIADAKQVLSPAQYKKALAEYVQLAINKATDTERKTFSSAKFGTFLKNNSAYLELAFDKDRSALQRLKDLTELMKVIPDSMSANPSGSAPTAFELFKGLLSVRGLTDAGALAGAVKDKAFSAIESQINKAEVNNILKGKEVAAGAGPEASAAKKAGFAMYRFLESGLNINPEAFQAMQDYIVDAAKGAYLFSRATKAVFDATEQEPVKPSSPKVLEKLDREMQSMQANPEKILEVGGQVGYYMPEQAESIGITTGRVASYLATKRPGLKKPSPLSKAIPPSKADLAAYQRTLQIAENPLVVLSKIKNGSLQSGDIRDLQAMYPEVYNEMLIKLTDSVIEAEQNEKLIPFKIKKSLSLFAGQPLEASLTPQAIQAAQATYQQQGQQAQGALPQMAPKSSRKSQIPSITQTDQQRRMLER